MNVVFLGKVAEQPLPFTTSDPEEVQHFELLRSAGLLTGTTSAEQEGGPVSAQITGFTAEGRAMLALDVQLQRMHLRGLLRRLSLAAGGGFPGRATASR
ncbi:hypothetical protein [Acidovorax sp. NCPPB 3576]|uniref:hypothetical protein n=1 Tax=Acidovorax sp. NCPPB 3576 TaxID=2940488 RepID=UPI00234B8E7C|nr:hypothetical protein [Acidovorax sp. NCPPB 3576]WCM89918.1 hypothetical protein M5C98_07815 [Acidovorax sp. NCPPB 3576]